ncbi:Y+L amino acid transporter 2-like isoform X2 [Asterias rubens]|uniref:Y+L amino acid transporter 2-like isoform X2 n=1 Tax=Asterias rubens TaxID=7604 RepID=UPI0014550FBD|nr:Y+L amino acid transporter 2-like isoform X2 [Asterias rubens]
MADNIAYVDVSGENKTGKPKASTLEQHDKSHDKKGEIPETQVTPDIRLGKKIGPLIGIGIVIGTMMGSGIFITPSFVLASSGSIGTSLLVWTAAGLISIIGALCYVELGTMIVESGGDYAYIHTSFGPLPAFMYIWVTTMVGAPTMLAIMASAFSNYLLYPFFLGNFGCKPPAESLYLLSAVVLILVAFLNIYSVKWVTMAQGVCTTIVVLALLVIIITGAVKIGQGNTSSFMTGFQDLQGLQTSPGSVAIAFYGAWFAFGGWSILNFLIEELQDPTRDLPLIIIVSLPTVTVINLLVNIAYLAVLEPQEILASNAVAFTFSQKALGNASWIMPVAVSISMIGAINGGFLKGSRTCMVGARKGQFPSILGLIQVQRKTPTPALLFVLAFALIFMASNDIRKLINCFSFVTWGFVLTSIIGLLYLRWKRPELPRPFKVNIVLPIFFSVTCVCLLIFGVIGAPFDALIGLGMTLTALPVYAVCIYWTSKPVWLGQFHYNITVFFQKLLFVGREETS